MVGSYGPRPEQEYEFITPIEEAPKGLLARGTYSVKSKFTDDDKHDHLSWEWSLTIKKEWKDWFPPSLSLPLLSSPLLRSSLLLLLIALCLDDVISAFALSVQTHPPTLTPSSPHTHTHIQPFVSTNSNHFIIPLKSFWKVLNHLKNWKEQTIQNLPL